MRTPFLFLLFLLQAFVSGAEAPALQEPAPVAVEKGFLSDIISLYQAHASPVLGERCPMHPSCSHYAQNALHQHGLVKGWIMACDRLIRCGRDEIYLSGQIRVNGHWRCHDPVDQNDIRPKAGTIKGVPIP